MVKIAIVYFILGILVGVSLSDMWYLTFESPSITLFIILWIYIVVQSIEFE